MPDFKQWSESLIEEYTKTNYSNCVVTVYNPKNITNALKQAFEQGIAYERRTKDNTTKYKGVF